MILSLVAICTLIMGLNAIQKGEVAWSRSKTITGPAAKRIGVVLIVLSVLLGVVVMGLSVMNAVMRDDYRTTHPSTTSSNSQ